MELDKQHIKECHNGTVLKNMNVWFAPLKCTDSKQMQDNQRGQLAKPGSRANSLSKNISILSVCPQLTELLGFTSHPTLNRSFRTRSSRPIAWLSTDMYLLLSHSSTALYTAIPMAIP